MQAKNIIGIDIGGTKIRSLLWTGTSLKSILQFKTPASRLKFIKLIKKIVNYYLTRYQVYSLGVGVPGSIARHLVLFCANIDYLKKFDFKKNIPELKKIRLDNDARCFARAEYLKGAGQGVDDVLALTIGTGIGRARVRANKIIQSTRFKHSEVWEKEYQEVRDSLDTNQLLVYLASKLELLIKEFRPAVVIIGGGVLKAQRGRFFYKLKRKLLAQGVRAKIKKAALKDNAAALGAALLFTK